MVIGDHVPDRTILIISPIYSQETQCSHICPPKIVVKGPGGSMSWEVGLPSNSYKPITNTAWVCAQLCKLQKACTRLAVASDKVNQLLALKLVAMI